MEECWVKINGVKIRYLESGKENNRHLLFIHGLGSAADRWMNIPKVLSSDFHCVAIDLPGFGESDRSADLDYTINFFRDFVVLFLEKVSIPLENTCIIGHSLGGYIASEIAIHNGIKQLVLIDSSGMLTQTTPVLDKYQEAANNPTKQNVRDAFEKMVADPARIPDILVDGFIRRITLSGAKHAFESTLKNSVTTQVGLNRLQQITMPTLIIWGIHDDVIPLNHSKFFKDSIANSRLEIIDDAGHAPFAEKPDIVCKLLREFLI